MTSQFSARLFKLLPMSMLLAAPYAALAQSPAAPTSSAYFADGLAITAQNGQSPEQQVADRTACETWSKGQTGFDIAQPTGGVSPSHYTSSRQQFDRAMTACLEARGYVVRMAAPPAPASSPPPHYGAPAPAAVYMTPPPAPTLAYQPFHASVSGGFSITTSDGSQNFDDGGLVNVGLSLFPVESIPVGIRVDGNYSWYGARDGFLYANNANIGHQEVYGGDVDLQFNLGPHNARSQFYVFGGAGWYRERTTLHQVSGFDDGGFCDFYCGGLFITGTAREITPWRDSWNAGLGWELALTGYSKFFVEARYRQIGPNDSREAFVPIQAGVRF